MMITPRLLKWRTVTARYGEADVFEVERSSDTSLIPGVAQADAPRPAIGVVADQSGLAEIGVDMRESQFAQHIGDAVGDKALADRIQRDAHSRTPQGYPARANVDQAIIDQPLGHASRGSVDVGRLVGAVPKVGCIKVPERLH